MPLGNHMVGKIEPKQWRVAQNHTLTDRRPEIQENNTEVEKSTLSKVSHLGCPGAPREPQDEQKGTLGTPLWMAKTIKNRGRGAQNHTLAGLAPKVVLRSEN